MVLVLDTATTITGSRERACRLPLMDYLAEKMCALCYERAWYAKLGGCIAIKFLFERMDLRWVLERQFNFESSAICYDGFNRRSIKWSSGYGKK